MQAAGPSSRWRLAPGQRLQHCSWDDETVLYNDLSGDTHLLGPSAVHLLLQLQAGDASDAELTASVLAAFDCAPDEDVGADVATLLAQLRGLALVEALA